MTTDLVKVLADCLGDEIAITVPAGEPMLSQYGQSLIGYYMGDNQLIPRNSFGYYTLSFSDMWATVGLEKVTKEGKLTRRLSSYLYKNHQVKVADIHLSAIGNLVDANLVTGGGTFTLGFVADRDSLWTPGDYGDHGSCYWGQHKSAPATIFNAGGAGLTVKKDGANFGRCWIAKPAKRTCLVMWNWYGISGTNWSLVKLSEMLTKTEGSPFYGVSYKPQVLSNSGCDQVYINTTGVALYVAGNQPEAEYVRLGFTPVDVEDVCECYGCGREMDEHDAYHFDGETYCDDCNPGRECDECGQEVHFDDMNYIDHRDICNRCLERHYTQCHECGDWTHDHNVLTLEDDRGRELSYCESCFPGVHCDYCDTYYHPDAVERVDTVREDVCSSCILENFTNCAQCGDLTPNADIETVEGSPYCESCASDLEEEVAEDADDEPVGQACHKCASGYAGVYVGDTLPLCAPCMVAELVAA